ncbi:227 kDa spindle- and centromere-associated protein-like [Daktulosphaira vitifoliae]|uniref:227 kDa spindle- and centromere-associated protein-like n=1 Tax=Daktulosphaira vitifoliae TaxID=58002 RepID=UPI0021AA9B8E|nr:227 kDa spindle- and centromere-associated protein-like [Daktulosphaira vitifoliae]
MEIRSSHLDPEEMLSALRNADQRAVDIANTVIRLNKQLTALQNKQNLSDSEKNEMCIIEKSLEETCSEYRTTVKQTLNLAEMVNFDLKNLEYRKINMSKYINVNANTDVLTAVRGIKADSVPEMFKLEKGLTPHNLFMCDRLIQNQSSWSTDSNENESDCSCSSGSNDVTSSSPKDTTNVEKQPKCNTQSTNKLMVDLERENVRDELMLMKGEMKIVLQQNRKLLNKLNCANERTLVLSKALRSKFPMFECGENADDEDEENKEKAKYKSKMQTLMNEIDRLRCELKEVNRDRCQIELARKVLNISDTRCANCVGLSEDDVQCSLKLKHLTEVNAKLSAENDAKTAEIMDLRQELARVKHDYETYEERLNMSKIQVTQLEQKLFELNSAKSVDPELEHSNNKYIIENLKHQLQVTNDDKTNLQMVLDYHLTELEDKKSKYLAVLQTNEEQKLRIEMLCKEKKTISTELEAELNRMKEQFNKCLKEVKTLPGALAASQAELEKERSLKEMVEKERDHYASEITSLKKAADTEDYSLNVEKYKKLEEENRQLKATVMTLEDALSINKQQYKERTHYALQLKEHLDTVRQEAAIQVTKIKDFAECQRAKSIEEIHKLEQQLAETRAMTCCEYKRRDNIEEQMKKHVLTLTTNLNEAQKQVEKLQWVKQFIETNDKDFCKKPRDLTDDYQVPSSLEIP